MKLCRSLITPQTKNFRVCKEHYFRSVRNIINQLEIVSRNINPSTIAEQRWQKIEEMLSADTKLFVAPNELRNRTIAYIRSGFRHFPFAIQPIFMDMFSDLDFTSVSSQSFPRIKQQRKEERECDQPNWISNSSWNASEPPPLEDPKELYEEEENKPSLGDYKCHGVSYSNTTRATMRFLSFLLILSILACSKAYYIYYYYPSGYNNQQTTYYYYPNNNNNGQTTYYYDSGCSNCYYPSNGYQTTYYYPYTYYYYTYGKR
ncbi:unnamed protein product [Caenorhabditis bovis]|uniref:Uncharacterized protein n=1 Tax=Caenorhabditis bovis TaxID=2654633 RepID=A0A8S1E747_9PELO|nr:unnamed protein product [Caenorhabditis bovis]